ncbi:hypothetical protein PAAG_08899 [Paracoccidioides lutzii Pb01]|uniref:Xylanolytic transcriptional activator regulatory domain-containing protein n=1 Tax=Paracoccidioides lutzii (strain ATCC MYA-826 / Pb01) TaxID=502779 RepID=C1HDP2_PARBA|nr:hypothetical protein PAAG_08899 [Paracoccidioides lutzii Pb01]EEH40036.2 hypothetical protein PAAG_08899 [Paracoccidioides lutzii Pb01]
MELTVSSRNKNIRIPRDGQSIVRRRDQPRPRTASKRQVLVDRRSARSIGDKEISSELPVEHLESLCSDTEGREETPSKGVGIFAEAGTTVLISDILENYLTTTAATRGRRLVCAVPLGNTSTRTARPVLFDTSPTQGIWQICEWQLAYTPVTLYETDDRAIANSFFAKANIRRNYAACAALMSILSGSKHAKLYIQKAFLSPGMSTVMAIMLNVGGRPSTTMLCKAGLLGLAVAFPNSIGLHRDPLNWNMHSSEKQLRLRIWWLVVVYNRWCSLAYVTPMHVHRPQHDIPLPNSQNVCSSNVSPSQVAATSVFVSLITLTEVLGSYLEYICHVAKTPTDHFEKTIAQTEVLLAQWEETLGDDIPEKRLLYHIQLDRDRGMAQADESSECPVYFRAQRTGGDIVHFVQELDESHMHGFWIPANAFTHSQRHRRDFTWDLADNCLENCSGMQEKIEAGVHYSGLALPNFEENSGIEVPVLDDLLTGFSDPFEMEFNPAANAVEHV